MLMLMLWSLFLGYFPGDYVWYPTDIFGEFTYQWHFAVGSCSTCYWIFDIYDESWASLWIFPGKCAFSLEWVESHLPLLCQWSWKWKLNALISNCLGCHAVHSEANLHRFGIRGAAIWISCTTKASSIDYKTGVLLRIWSLCDQCSACLSNLDDR